MNADYAYEQIDRLLRNKLDDDDYEEYSKALETIATACGAAERKRGN